MAAGGGLRTRDTLRSNAHAACRPACARWGARGSARRPSRRARGEPRESVRWERSRRCSRHSPRPRPPCARPRGAARWGRGASGHARRRQAVGPTSQHLYVGPTARGPGSASGPRRTRKMKERFSKGFRTSHTHFNGPRFILHAKLYIKRRARRRYGWRGVPRGGVAAASKRRSPAEHRRHC